MRPLFGILLLTAALFGVSIWYQQTATICPVPISYRLGDFDERFLITKEEAGEVLAAAERVWEEALGRDLFEYDDESTFAINFIFDERQQLARTEEEWRTNLDKQELESAGVIERVKAEGVVYQSLQADYEEKRVAYEERLSIYNEEVERYNEEGGAPEEEFEKLEEEEDELSDILRDLLDLEKELNAKAESINKLGEEGNALIETYNAEVLKYNEVYGNRDLYTQGDFQRDQINVYKFSDTTELTKVIAHEFGHALGIGHVEGAESIMYYLMAEQPDTIIPTVEDRTALVELCGDGTGFSHLARKIIRSALSFL